VVTGRVVPLRIAAPHVGDFTCRVVSKAMAIDPGDRQRTAIELHGELGSARASEAKGRQWHTVQTHPGHEKCWECPPLGTKKALRVCLILTGSSSKYDIRAEHIQSGRLYRSGQTTNSKKAQDMRKMFKTL
jgi:hypothetical protein